MCIIKPMYILCKLVYIMYAFSNLTFSSSIIIDSVWNICILQFRGCIVFHVWTDHTYLASHEWMEIHSFNNSLPSTYYVRGNYEGLCGPIVSKGEMIPA